MDLFPNKCCPESDCLGEVVKAPYILYSYSLQEVECIVHLEAMLKIDGAEDT